jgi:hypothetical protein
MKVWLLLAVWGWWLKGESVAEPQAAAHLLFPFDGQFVRPPDDQRPAREGTHIPVILLVRREARVLEPDLAWKKIAFSALNSLAYGFSDLSAVPSSGGGNSTSPQHASGW